MSNSHTTQKPRVTVSAKVLRKDGTVDDLGVIASSRWGWLVYLWAALKIGYVNWRRRHEQ